MRNATKNMTRNAVADQTRSLMIALTVMFFAACTNGPCRQVKNPELANQQSANAAQAAQANAGSAGASASTAPAKGVNAVTPTLSKQGTLFVSKPDGSLQCGQGQAMSPQEMEKQLEGIKVFSRENRSDGLMHIQVCGSPTGMINVFEILAGSLKDAEKRGFKKFEAP
jgi:hypothetical protein